MNRDDIISMAKQAGVPMQYSFVGGATRWHFDQWIEHFANLIAAAERETCAKLVDEEMADYRYGTWPNIALNNAAAAIRARGQ